jgi:hypothetical protein
MGACRICRATGAVIALALAVPGTAGAHTTRYTSPAASATSGDCSSAFPCRLDYAVEGASDGDTVAVASGEYRVDVPVHVPAIDVVGAAGPAPRIIGADTLMEELFSARSGGTLRHLFLQSTATGQDALVLEGGTAEDVEILASGGDGAKIVGAPSTTIMRDSVVRGVPGSGDSAPVKLTDGTGGDVALRNVTVFAPSSTAIRCDLTGGQATLVNVIARGSMADVDASKGGADCLASYSNLRATQSPSLVLGAGIQDGEPLFADPGNGDLRPLAGSPTIDAGITDALTSTTDPDGQPRGATPDIGAFECCGTAPVTTPTPTPTTEPTGTEHPAHVPTPVLGSTVVVARGSGRVLVRLPGGKAFKRLGEAVELPVGTLVDARLGRIRLTSAIDLAGTAQTGSFWGGRFQIAQSAHGGGMTSLKLRGGSFARCPRPRARSSSLARTSSVARDYPRRKVVRRLWARDRGGRFRTFGNNSVATARGTAWITRDRCDGTVTRVLEGAVAVRDRKRHKTVLVRAGHRYLARR